MKEGSIILAPIPQANGEVKNIFKLPVHRQQNYEHFLI
jgi:hypothetical protein